MLLVPTRRRIEKLTTFCKSAQDTETKCPAILIVDKKDWTDNSVAYDQIRKDHFPNKDWQFYQSDAEGMGDKVREVWDFIDSEAKWVAILNDDHVIKTKYWDTRTIALLNGKNFVTGNDRWNSPLRAAGITMWSMPLLKAAGFPIFPPQISHLGIDDVWEIIGKNTGCWDIDMGCIIEHHHVYQDNARMDETHSRVYGTGQWFGSEQMKNTQEAVQKWIQEDAKGVIERIKALQDSDLAFSVSS